MHVLCGSVATLAVASIYYTWRAYFYEQLQQTRLLHERVAYLIWVLANNSEQAD